MRLIDADAVVARIIEVRDELPPEQIYEVGYHNGLSMAHAIVLAAPTIEEKRGRWGEPFKVDADNNGYKCSKCGEFGVPCWNYCPNCGAKMEVDK